MNANMTGQPSYNHRHLEHLYIGRLSKVVLTSKSNIALFSKWVSIKMDQRTLSIAGSITVRLVFSLNSTASLHTINHMFSFLVKSNLFKLETSDPSHNGV